MTEKSAINLMKIPVHIILVLWGKEYTDLYLNYTAYNHFSPGNVPSLNDEFDVTYCIYTHSPETIAAIRTSKTFEMMVSKAKIKIFQMPEIDHTNFKRVSVAHNLALQIVNHESAIACFVHADQIWADGSFRRAFDKINEGYRSVECLPLRCSQRSFLAEFQIMHAATSISIECMTLAASRLVAMATRNRHPQSLSFPGGYVPLPNEPATLCRFVGDEGLIVRTAHLFPFVIYPEVRLNHQLSSSDEDFVSSMVPDRSRRYIVRDSDEVFACDLSLERLGADHMFHISELSPSGIGQYLSKHPQSWRDNFQHLSLQYHATPQTPDVWEREKQAFEPIVKDVMRHCKAS